MTLTAIIIAQTTLPTHQKATCFRTWMNGWKPEGFRCGVSPAPHEEVPPALAGGAPLDSLFLKRAEQSVAFADEILIIRDRDDIHDFSTVRNHALRQAKGEWVLFVDSDEEVTAELAEEIQQALQRSTINHKLLTVGFLIRRHDYFLGRWLKHGETGNARFLRLARKGAGQWVRPVHEQWTVHGPVGTLRQAMLHWPHQSVASMLEKIERYAEIEAGYRPGKASQNIMRIIIEMMVFPKAKFIQNYLLRLGCLDGFPGLIMALMMSFHSFLVRAHEVELWMKGQ